MATDKAVVTDKRVGTEDAGHPVAAANALATVSLKECRDATTAMKPACTADLSALHLTDTLGTTNAIAAVKEAHAIAPTTGDALIIQTVDRATSNTFNRISEGGIEDTQLQKRGVSENGISNITNGGDGQGKTTSDMSVVSDGNIPRITNDMVNASDTLERSQVALKNTEKFLTDTQTSAEDKLKAAGILASNGINEVKTADGTEYKFAIDKQNNVELKTISASGQISEASAKISPDGSQVIKEKGSNGAVDNSPTPEGGDRPPTAIKPTGKDALFDPSLSQEDKLRAAREMADHGQKRFKGPDGKEYEISTQKFGNRESVSIFQNDAKGHSHVMMRGIVDDKGNVTEQHDRKGHKVDIQGDWAKHNGADSALLRHDQVQPPRTDDGGDKTHLQGSPEELKQLDASRERLKKDVASNISSSEDRDRFNKDMEALEQRAKTQPLPAKEVSDTYDQLSKLLEAKDGAVPKPDRVLAAETFAHHMGEPTNIDQGNHNTCNMTTLEEHLITRNPSKAAEIVSTMAQTGHWTAPDGKEIKIAPGSLVPGPEERDNPPGDNKRSYATQLLNLALINDANQRKVPPEFYTQERPTGQSDTGERLRFADGSDVTKDDVQHNGDKTPVHGPAISCAEISREGKAINGEGNFVIANGKVDNGEGVVHINNADDLKRQLTDMKTSGKLPAIIMVDSNTTAFGGDPSRGPGWHVVSVTGFDESTGKVHISNQWGKDADRDMQLNDLYRSTYTN